MAYHAARAGAAIAPEYYGVWRAHNIRYDKQMLPVRVLVVYSVSKARLDATKREAQLQQLLQRLADIHLHLNQRKYKPSAYTWD
ncbi:MAG: hypothetical protein EXR62_05045 [Chloroflexi bacterium]|nr:hypothetical protein [Chloroflexota bacterium]